MNVYTSKTKLNEAKYSYVLANKNNKDKKTYEYLKELKKANYKDSKSSYTQLYKWKVEVVINNGASSVKWNKKTDVKLVFSGGEPGSKLKYRVKTTYPNGNVETDAWTYAYAGGDQSGFYWGTGVMLSAYSGTLTIRVYDSSGKLLGQASIKVTR